MIHGLPPYYNTNRQIMYKQILRAKLSKPKSMSADAFDLCQKLLERDPTQRLGYNGPEEIKAHPWFASIDFDKLLRMEIEPPFKPKVKDAADVSTIDEVFLTERAEIAKTLDGASVVAKSLFEGFTF